MVRQWTIAGTAIVVLGFGGQVWAAIPKNQGQQSTAQKKAPKSAAVRSGARKKSKSAKTTRAHKPVEFTSARVDKLYTQLMARPPRIMSSGEATEIAPRESGKQAWLGAIYSRNLVEASAQTELLSDKLIMARVLERALEGEARRFYPKTLGLKEFLARHKLVSHSGKVTAKGDQIEKALYEEFPAGFVVRPAVGVAPYETRKGLYAEGDNFIVALLSGKAPFYENSHYRKPVKSSILGEIASGEAVVLQDDIILRADSKKKLNARTFREIRIHTYENGVVEGGVPTRWVQQASVKESEIKAAEGFVTELLKRLPPRLVVRQAWGIDVAVFDNGEMMITDIVTNRGRRIQWSGYLEQPRVLGAYTRHFEKVAGVRFEGLSGSLIRNNFGNYMSYWDARIDKAPSGWSKVLSYLPPVP